MGLILFATLGALALADPDDPGPVVIEVDAGQYERIDTPVTFPLPAGFDRARAVGLTDLQSGEAVPVQLEAAPNRPGSKPEGPPSARTVLSLPAGSKRRFRLHAGGAPVPSGVLVRQDKGATTALVRGKEVWTYQSDTATPPPGFDPVYERSGFLHPLRSPSGRVVTDDFAADHPHQHGLFFAWTSASFRGKPINFWDQLQKTARVRDVSPSPTLSPPGAAPTVSFRIRHEALAGADGATVPVLDEDWRITTYPQAGPFLVDLESSQTAATDEPLALNEYHYGGLGFRGNIAWYDTKVKGVNPPDPSRSGESDYLTSDGKTRADGNGTRPKWLDIYGKVDGQFAGIAVLQHPSNFRSPQPVRLHPNKPYFSVAPAALGPFKIEPGTPYVSKYRLVLHDGKPDPKQLDRLWNDYAEPPAVRVVNDNGP